MLYFDDQKRRMDKPEAQKLANDVTLGPFTDK
jgi:hypothetical protein